MTEASYESSRSADYGVWTRSIGEHFFPVGAGLASIHLSFDDTLATQIGRGFGGSVHDFELAVRKVIDPTNEPTFFKVLPRLGVHYGPLGLLAAQVLTATRMGSITADASTAYWAPFRHAFTGDQPLKQISFDTLDRFWHLAKAHYERLGRGNLAIQIDPSNVPLAGKRHINLPLFQALLRETDRAQLRSWFHENPDVVRLPADKLIRHLFENAGSFNKKLAQTLHDTQNNSQLAAAFASLVGEVAMSTDVTEFSTRRSHYIAGRLRLIGMRALDCVLQRREAHSRWIDVSDALDDFALLDGYQDEVSGARWRGDDRMLFTEGAPFVGFVSHQGMVSPGAIVILVYLKSDEELLERLRDTVGGDITLGPSLTAYCASRIVVTELDDDLLQLFECRLSLGKSIRLDGGLSVGRVWLSSRPPTVITTGVSYVEINEKLHPVDEKGEVRLPSPLLPGRYIVKARHEQLVFEVEDGEKLADSSDGEEIVYALTPLLPTCGIDKITSGRYLVGAYLGQAPP